MNPPNKALHRTAIPLHSIAANELDCYQVKSQIIDVIKKIGNNIERIYIVDDSCPEHTGNFIENNCKDKRITVLYHNKNKGVGGAVKTGFKAALKGLSSIIVKLDGDGQMYPGLIPESISPIQNCEADFVKGNRFFEISFLKQMPLVRKIGNSILSLINKFVSGYWNIMDPTNGFIAIQRTTLELLPLNKIDDRYFFESDLLFRLYTIRAVVREIPMQSKYADEKSGMNIIRIIFEFSLKYINRFIKRIGYNYFLRDFNVASIQLILGIIIFNFGVIFGIYYWYKSIQYSQIATSGTVMLSALPIIIGFQLLLSSLQYDIANIPKYPLQKQFRSK